MVDIQQRLRQTRDRQLVFTRVVILEGAVGLRGWERARRREIVTDLSDVEVLGLVGVAI